MYESEYNRHSKWLGEEEGGEVVFKHVWSYGCCCKVDNKKSNGVKTGE